VRDLVVEMLEERGYTVLAAKNATDAIDIAEDSQDVALLLTDLVMPHMNGQELANRVREHQPSIRLLFMSGYADEAVTRHGTLARKAAFIEKPFTSKRLAMTVRGLLDSTP
jgi:CheY-like chemotaxis protein